MNFEELVLKRQSDRRYLPDPVSKEDVMKCLEAARMSPSACNSQPWKFVVVDDKNKLAEMAEAAEGLGMNKFTHNVPVMVAVVLEKMNASARLGSLIKGKDYCMMDLDEDEVYRIFASRQCQCPYYRQGDDYTLARRQ